MSSKSAVSSHAYSHEPSSSMVCVVQEIFGRRLEWTEPVGQRTGVIFVEQADPRTLNRRQSPTMVHNYGTYAI